MVQSEGWLSSPNASNGNNVYNVNTSGSNNNNNANNANGVAPDYAESNGDHEVSWMPAETANMQRETAPCGRKPAKLASR